jgi:hypothetical protein
MIAGSSSICLSVNVSMAPMLKAGRVAGNPRNLGVSRGRGGLYAEGHG